MFVCEINVNLCGKVCECGIKLVFSADLVSKLLIHTFLSVIYSLEDSKAQHNVGAVCKNAQECPQHCSVSSKIKANQT